MKEALFRFELDHKHRERKAAKAWRYIARAQEDAERPDRLIHLEAGNMPAWCDVAQIGRDYWEAADRHSRQGGRRYFEIKITLPTGLSRDQYVHLGRAVAVRVARVTEDGQGCLPFTFAVHAGYGWNPHIHLVISPSLNDGLPRGAERWFRRFNARRPELGGARKSRVITCHWWLLEVRQCWEEVANRLLRQWGTGLFIDRRSLAAKGLDRVPTIPLGPVPRPGRSNVARERRRQRNLAIEEENRRRDEEQRQQLNAAEERRKELSRRAREAFARRSAQLRQMRPDFQCDIAGIDDRRRMGLRKLVARRDFQEMMRNDLGPRWECGSDAMGIVWLHATEPPIFDLGDRVIAGSANHASALAVVTLLARRTDGNIEISGTAEWQRQLRVAWHRRSELIARPEDGDWALNADHARDWRPNIPSRFEDRDTCDGEVGALLTELLEALICNSKSQPDASLQRTRLP